MGSKELYQGFVRMQAGRLLILTPGVRAVSCKQQPTRMLNTLRWAKTDVPRSEEVSEISTGFMYPAPAQHSGCQAKYAVLELDAIVHCDCNALGRDSTNNSRTIGRLMLPSHLALPGGYATPQLICDE